MKRNVLRLLHGQSEFAVEAFEGRQAAPARLRELNSAIIFLNKAIPL